MIDQEIDAKKQELRIEEKDLVGKKKSQIVGGVLAAVGAVSAVAGTASFTVLVLLGCVLMFFGFFMVFGNGGASVTDREKTISALQEELDSLQRQLALANQTTKQSTRQIESQIDYRKEIIQATQNQILDLQHYLEIGQERIANLCFADRCKVIGMEIKCDLSDQKLREIVLKN